MAARPDRDTGAAPRPAGPSDLARCPLCGAPNDCAIANGDCSTPCWCVGQHFDGRLFSLIGAHDLGRRCVCARCAFDPPLDAQARRRPGSD